MNKQRDGVAAPSVEIKSVVERAIAAALDADLGHLTDVVSWHSHVPFANVLIDLLAPDLVVELGVHQGDSLLSIAAALHRLGQRGRVVGIDTWRGDPHAGAYDGTAVLDDLMTRAVAFGPRVTLLRSTFDAALSGFADGSIDLLHIDGLHTYEAVRHDFDTWRPKLSRRGVVLFHDIAVTSADFGVHQLWEEVRNLGPSHGFAFGNGLGVLALGSEVPAEVLTLLTALSSTPATERIFTAIGEAVEGRSLRRALTLRAEALQTDLELLRTKATEEINRLNEELRSVTGSTIDLRKDLEQQVAAAQALVRSEQARLEAELEAVRGHTGEEIARLNDLIAAERETASSALARLEAELTATQDAGGQEIARLNAVILDERQTAEALLTGLRSEVDTVRTRADLEMAQLTAALEVERRALAKTEELLQAALAQAEDLRRETEANRTAAQEEADTALTRAVMAETALASERELARIALDMLKQKVTKAGRDLGLARARLTRETKRADGHAAKAQELAAMVADAEQRLAALQAKAAGAETEVERLNALIGTERMQAQAEIARLDALVDADRKTGKTEIDRLNREIAVLHRDYTAALERARLKSRAVRLFKRVAMPTFRLLPLPRKTKQRLRLAIVNRYGAALELVPPKAPAMATQTQLALRQLSTRYLSLSRASTGIPANLPRRSVSIIIPVFNQIEYTLRCLDAIKLNTTEIEHEIIVVDDGSTDMTEIMLSPRTDIVYIRNAQNLGFIGSCNAGLARASKTYVCFLNNDTEVTPVWLSALVDTFEMHPSVGLAGSQLVYPDGRLQEAGGIIWDDFSGWNWGRLQDPEAPRYTYARMADYCSGAAILLPRALANGLGGFDPEFTPAYGEDSDLAFRLRAMGLSTVYQPLSRVVHYEGISSGTDTSKGVKAYQVVNAAKLKDRWAHVLPHHGANGEDPERAVERGRIGRVLVIDQITPEPDKDAGSITALELMLALRDLGYKVSFIPCSNFTYIPDYTDLLGGLGIESVLYPWAKSVDDHLMQAADRYDAVVIFRVNTAADNLAAIRRLAPRAKVIFHNSDLHFLREERARTVDNPNVAERQLSPDTTKARELSIIGDADVTIVHSHFEADLLATAVPQTPVVVFPWVYESRGAGPSFSDRKDIIFLGGYRHYPNVDAVLHYAKDIAPHLQARLPQMRFRAIGSNPTAEMKSLASPQLTIEGFVDDLGPVLGEARMMLVPLRYGAGLKGKIVTALAHGLPVVTTSVGAEGMALRDGEQVLLADTPQEIADAVFRLYTDEDLWKRLARNGLKYVADTTSRSAGLRTTRQILGAAGLGTVPVPSTQLSESRYLAPLGSPAALSDIAIIASSIRRVRELSSDQSLNLVFGATGASGRLTCSDPRGLLVNELATMPAVSAGAWVLVLDGCDDAAADASLATLRGKLAGPPPIAVVFLPPRLDARDSGFAMTHVLSGQAVADAEARAPVHLRHAERLAITFGANVRWVCDTSILGFPSLTIALIDTP